jgi:hypothetical protein
MSGWKEVWYVWDGYSKKIYLIKRFALSNGRIEKRGEDYRDKGGIAIPVDAILYTTGQMRRRVECFACGDVGEDSFISEDEYNLDTCYVCNGKGYQWEYKQLRAGNQFSQQVEIGFNAVYGVQEFDN